MSLLKVVALKNNVSFKAGVCCRKLVEFDEDDELVLKRLRGELERDEVE